MNVFKKETTASLSTGCLLKLTNGISNSVDYFNKNEKKSFYYNVQPGLHVGVKKSKLLFYSSALITNFKIEFHTLSEFLTFFEKITDEILYGSKIIGIRQCLTFRQCISHLAQLDDWGKEVLDNWNFMTIYQCLPDLQVLPSTVQQQTVLFLLSIKDLVIIATRLQILFQGKDEVLPAETPH